MVLITNYEKENYGPGPMKSAPFQKVIWSMLSPQRDHVYYIKYLRRFGAKVTLRVSPTKNVFMYVIAKDILFDEIISAVNAHTHK